MNLHLVSLACAALFAITSAAKLATPTYYANISARALVVKPNYIFLAYPRERYKGWGVFYDAKSHVKDMCYSFPEAEDNIIHSLKTGPWLRCVSFYDDQFCQKGLLAVKPSTDAAWLDNNAGGRISSFKFSEGPNTNCWS